MKADDNLFEIAALEISNHAVVKGIMARAFSDALGDKEKSVALYIKYRVANLKEEREIFLQKKGEEERNARIKLRKEKAEREKQEANDRATMKDALKTVCKKCGYAGSMKISFISYGCKCPKCSHRFDWYYIPSKDFPKTES